jgi:predicted AAA+ superfamily ATPase
VRSYFEILEATLIGRFLPAYGRSGRRRLIESPRFYFFDVGIAGTLCRRGEVTPGSELFGRAFEHFLFLELAAYCNYRASPPVSYWRTASGLEVDFILGEGKIAIEAKATSGVHAGHLGGLRAFKEEHHPSRAIVVSLDPRPRTLSEGLEILPWKSFLSQLWGDLLL